MNKKNRLKREQETVSKMIALYCRSHHSPPPGHICPDCQSLAEYAHQRIDRCPLRSTLRVGLDKPTCAKMPHPLLQTGREGRNSHGHALFWPPHAPSPPHLGHPPPDRRVP